MVRKLLQIAPNLGNCHRYIKVHLDIAIWVIIIHVNYEQPSCHPQDQSFHYGDTQLQHKNGYLSIERTHLTLAALYMVIETKSTFGL